MCIYINWAALTINILFVCGLPSYEYQLGRSDNILNLDYPPIINVFRQPSEPFLSRLVSCTNSYSPRMFQCIWNACMPFPIQSNHMQIYKHESNIKIYLI